MKAESSIHFEFIKKPQRGRSKELLIIRNEKLIKRFYQKFEVERKRLDDVLKELSIEEFWISPARIMEIIQENQEQLDRLYSKTDQS